jgi:hypothetical protein
MRRLLPLSLLVLSSSVAMASTAPVILNLAPSSAVVGSPSFTLIVNGVNFVDASQVLLNGVGRTTAFVNSGQLTAAIPNTDLLSVRTLQITVFNPDGLLSSAVPFDVLPNSPQITSIDPSTVTSGGPAFAMRVSGQNFDSSSVVNLNGTARTTTYIDSAGLSAQVTASDISEPRTINVTVRNPNNHLSNGVPLTVTTTQPTPTITVLNPNTVNAGGAAFMLEIVGTNFASGAQAFANGLTRATTRVDSSHVMARILSSDINTPGSILITVSNPSTPQSNAVTLTVVGTNVAIISSINPQQVTEKSGQFTLSVTGSGFVSGAMVQWNGSNRGTTFVDSQHLTAIVLASDITNPGQALITVENPNGAPVSNSVTLFIVSQNGPAITSLNPASVAAGSADTRVLIDGTNFLFDDVAQVNGADRATEFVSASQLVVTVTAGDLATAGSLQIVVRRRDRSAASAPVTLTVGGATGPLISSLNPSRVTAGSPDFTLIVNGSNFQDGAAVTVDSAPRGTTFISQSQLNVSVLASDVAVARLVPIAVVNPAGVTSPPVNLNVVLLVPTITSISPTSVTSGDVGFQLAVSGTDFSAQSVINVGGVPRSTTLQNATGALTTQISAADISAPGALSITVTDNGATSDPILLTILRPSIVSVTPSSIPVGGTDATIVVTGTGFLTTSKIIFKGSEKATNFNADASLSAKLDAGDLQDSGSFAVLVRNSPDSTSLPFLIDIVSSGGATISSVTPSTIQSGSGSQPVVVIGTNFTPTSIVQVNGSPRVTTFVSSTELHAQLLASDTAAVGQLSVVVADANGKLSPAVIINVTGPAPPRQRSVRH